MERVNPFVVKALQSFMFPFATVVTRAIEPPPPGAGHVRSLVTETTHRYYDCGPGRPQNDIYRGAGGPGIPAHCVTTVRTYWTW